MTEDDRIEITRVGNGFIVRPVIGINHDRVVANDEMMVFQSLGQSSGSTYGALMDWLESHFPEKKRK